MDKKQAHERLKKLRQEIDHHRYMYAVFDRQKISDAALDSLKHELVALESEFPELITPDSPSQRVAGKPLKKFKKVKHAVRMLSLNDVFSEDELLEWEQRMKKNSSGKKIDYFAEAKGDGFAISLIYSGGMLISAATRGDGFIGENVTENIKTINDIPLHISDSWQTALHRESKLGKIMKHHPHIASTLKNIPNNLEVRGEIYMTKENFDAVNAKQTKNGLPTFANPRNVAAGSVRQLDPKTTAARNLSFFAWDLIAEMGQKTHEEEHLIMKLLGFPVVPYSRYCETLRDVKEFWTEIHARREKMPFNIDGIVVQINDGNIFEELGIVGKAPRGAIAFKFPAEEATSIVQNISVQVGRTGVLTPVATLAPIHVGGVTVTHATLHNMDEIKRLDVRIGDTVIIKRAGDVIPAIIGALKRLRPKNAKVFTMPKRCPMCDSPIVRHGGEVAFYCSNKNCSAVQREQLYHFVSKGAMNIQGLGPKIIDALLDNGLIKDAGDLFTLKKEDVEQIERFAEKSAANLIRSIAEKKSIELSRLIFSLGIRHVGEETAIDLAQKFDTLDKLRNAALEHIEKIPNIGPVVAKSIYEWFEDPRNKLLLKKLSAVGLRVRHLARTGGSTLAGKTLVLTGALATMTRDDAKALIRSIGGTISEAVGKKTDFVVVGTDPGSKFNKAIKLGIKTLNEQELRAIINK